MVFTLFRGSFEVVFLLFCSSEGPRDYPRPAIRSLPSVSGFPVVLPRVELTFESAQITAIA